MSGLPGYDDWRLQGPPEDPVWMERLYEQAWEQVIGKVFYDADSGDTLVPTEVEIDGFDEDDAEVYVHCELPAARDGAEPTPRRSVLLSELEDMEVMDNTTQEQT